MAFLGGFAIESAFLKALISLIKGCANMLEQHKTKKNKSSSLGVNFIPIN
jgi:hypothetical protein